MYTLTSINKILGRFKMVDTPIPEAFFTKEGLPSVDDLFELGQLPAPWNEWVITVHSRRIDIHEFELEDHVELFVCGQDVLRKSVHIMCEWGLPNGD